MAVIEKYHTIAFVIYLLYSLHDKSSKCKITKVFNKLVLAVLLGKATLKQ